MKAQRAGLMVAVLALVPTAMARAGAESLGGIGILGDSYSDEYQFYPPDRTTARNWMEILAATRGLDFGRFSVRSRGEPRNQGYEFNWARSDATTDDLIATGQHTGLAAQVARGQVRIVCIFIGGNDFINALKAPVPLDALRGVLPRALSNYRAAVETIRSADPQVRLVLATVPDIRNLPEFAAPLRDGRLPQAVADAFTAAIARYNAQVQAIASKDPQIALLDLDLAVKIGDLVSRDHVHLVGRRLDRIHPSNAIDHFFLADVRHPGTVGHGLLARMLVATLNAKFDAGIAPLREDEIHRFAAAVAAAPPSGDSAGGPEPGLPFGDRGTGQELSASTRVRLVRIISKPK